ncbi:MAG: 4'-phosphopantetheinyl transferase superfamily protein, partial [Chloroflexota bacterium]|nr:4'-phosphopantetheinyl transferase superfamily protein [Chloroflexota bacterium]
MEIRDWRLEIGRFAQHPTSNLQRPGKDEIHVWRASLDLPAIDLRQLQQTLTEDESNRAARFYFQKDREHYIACRGLLRVILSRYLDVAPGEIRFCYGHYGKPELASSMRRQDLSFNVSHSHGLALVAIAAERKIGVDIEYIRLGVEIESIAERFFAPNEKAVIRTLTGYQQRETFYNCWTRKEAFLKACGDGMTCPLDQFEVSVAPGVPAALISARDDPQAARWSLQELGVADGYVATV